MAGWTFLKTWVAGVLPVTDMNTYVRDNLEFLKANIALEASVELTIAGGVVTKTKSYHRIDTTGDVPSSDLDTINGGSGGDVLFIEAEHTDRTIVVKNGTGNIQMPGGDVSLDATGIVLTLIYNGRLSKWVKIAP